LIIKINIPGIFAIGDVNTIQKIKGFFVVSTKTLMCQAEAAVEKREKRFNESNT
jgi:thioredoxin reductase